MVILATITLPIMEGDEKKMKASTVCKYALAIAYGVSMGKFLGELTKGFADGFAEGLLSVIEKSESKSK